MSFYRRRYILNDRSEVVLSPNTITKLLKIIALWFACHGTVIIIYGIIATFGTEFPVNVIFIALLIAYGIIYAIITWGLWVQRKTAWILAAVIGGNNIYYGIRGIIDARRPMFDNSVIDLVVSVIYAFILVFLLLGSVRKIFRLDIYGVKS